MTQQVNLYSEILKQQQRKAIVTLYIAIVVFIVVMFIAFSAYLLWSVNTAETSFQNEQLILKNEQTYAEQLALQHANPAFNTQWVEDIKQWQNKINEAEKTVRLIDERMRLSEKNFSDYLQALANQSDRDVWITAIHITGENRSLSIQGSTFKPEKVPQLLQRLQKDPVFKGEFFNKLVMEPSLKKTEQINFTLK